MIRISLSTAILDTKSATGVFPFDGAIDAGDLARAAFQTTGKLNQHFSLFVKGVKVCRASIDTKPFFTIVTNFLVKSDMGFFVVLEGIESKFLSNFHLLKPSIGSVIPVKTGIQVIRIRKNLDSCLRRNDKNDWKYLHLPKF